MANPYTRQSSFSDGDTVTSALFNDEYDQLVLSFSSTVGHTHDGSTGEGAPITKLGPTQDVVIAAASILPKTNNVVDLGSSSLKFKDGYFAGNVTVDGVVTHSGNMIIGDAATDTLTINATIQGSSLVFEGATANAHELTLAIPDATSDVTVTLPNATDTLVGKATTDVLTNKTLTSAVLNTGVSGTAVLDEDNFASDSATKLATQQSIKAYIATQVSVGDITSVVAGTGLTGGATSGAATVNVIGGTGITANADDIAIDSTVTTLTGSQTLTNKTLTSPVLNTGVSGTAVLDEDNMSTNSATKLATQQSIKAYVDTQVATVPVGDITSVVAGTGLTGGATSGAATVNVIGGTGITANADDIAIDSTVTTLTGSQTLTNKTLTSPVLNTGLSGTAFLDEDNFASDSATKVASQQSIKAYIATQVSVGDITSVVAGTGLTGGATSGDATLNVIGGTGITANADDIAIDSTVTTLTGSQTLTNKTLTSPVLNTGISGSAVLDEDNLASDSATKLATQQSIKAYVDSEVSGGALTTEQVQDIVGGMVSSNTESGITVTYQDGDGTLDFTVSPVALTTVQTAGNQSAHLALTTEEGDVVIRSDENKTYMHNGGSAGSMSDFTLMATPTDSVTSVAGNTGVVTNAHIATAVEAASDSNTFTDADHSKLNAIEASATADQTASQIKTLLEDGIDSVHYVDASIDNAHLADDAVGVAELSATGTASSTTFLRGDNSWGVPIGGVTSVNSVTGAITAAHIATAVEAASDSNTFTDADHSKLNAVAASANNYVHPNHSGEVTSTADGATVIADNVVDEANLKVSNSPTNGYVLTAQSGNTGGLTWAVDAGGSSVTTSGLWEHTNAISSNYTIASGNNALTAGPITINSGVSVTVPSGSTWAIV